MTWFVLSLLSIFALATAELTQQYLLNKQDGLNEKTSAALTLFFEALLVVPFLFIFGLHDQIFAVFRFAILPRLVIVTFISSIATFFYFKSFKVKIISVSSIFTSFSVITSTFLGILFFSESTSFLKFLIIIGKVTTDNKL